MFNSPRLTSAGRKDISLYKSLLKFKNIHKKKLSSTSSVLNCHTWYLTEELIPLSLFDKEQPLEKRTLLATKIGLLITPGGTEICKPTLPIISPKSELADFVGERSTTLFDLLSTPVDFLLKPNWHLQPEKISVKTSIKNLSPSMTLVNELLDMWPNSIPTLQGTRSPLKNWSKLWKLI
ncbi:hypothetical protein ACHWQZ_G011060 [Mnemiopsis leidyi]